MKTKTISWFSAGVSSAVATKMIIDEIDEIIYTHIDDQHPDTMRFVKDCEAWFGKPITILQSDFKTVENVLRMKGFVNSPRGAPCTGVLKRAMRHQWETLHAMKQLRYVWGLDIEETKPRPPRNMSRKDVILESMPYDLHVFPLIDRNMTKTQAHKVLNASGIKRPAMYDLGYHNNNCVGCVKGSAGYWNKIRVDFPEVFEARAKMERLIGGSILNGVYLDELDPEAGRKQGPIVDDCGIMCELMKL